MWIYLRAVLVTPPNCLGRFVSFDYFRHKIFTHLAMLRSMVCNKGYYHVECWSFNWHRCTKQYHIPLSCLLKWNAVMIGCLIKVPALINGFRLWYMYNHYSFINDSQLVICQHFTPKTYCFREGELFHLSRIPHSMLTTEETSEIHNLHWNSAFKLKSSLMPLCQNSLTKLVENCEYQFGSTAYIHSVSHLIGSWWQKLIELVFVPHPGPLFLTEIDFNPSMINSHISCTVLD